MKGEYQSINSNKEILKRHKYKKRGVALRNSYTTYCIYKLAINNNMLLYLFLVQHPFEITMLF